MRNPGAKMEIGTFPFGQPVRKLVQQDRTPKRVFVLGKYASAVHARWEKNDGGVVQALAVASEPYIFWRGEGAAEIINKIDIPKGLGRLKPADSNKNGPSGIALDEFILKPVGMSRLDVWLCDLVPYSLMNSRQEKAIQSHYLPICNKINLPPAAVPPESDFYVSDERRIEIANEIKESKAEVLITLGDAPLEWFLSYFNITGRKRLADYGESESLYGRTHIVTINSKPMRVLPLVHPRQAGRLGAYSKNWYRLHNIWIKNIEAGILTISDIFNNDSHS